MRRYILYSLFFIMSFCIGFAQQKEDTLKKELKPTLTHALINVTVKTKEGEKLSQQTVIFLNEKTGESFSTVTDSNGVSKILLPE